MRIIVGSKAMKYWEPNYRQPADIDIWTDRPFSKRIGYDYKSIPTHILQLVKCANVNGELIATPHSLYTIKCSHLGWNNPNWNKHKLDLLYMQQSGCELIQPLYDALITFWQTELGDKSFLSLNKSKQDFFTDKVVYKFDHDWLHEQVAYPNPPTYTLCLQDGADVLIDRSKFDQLTHDQQISMFREEITVIAIERWLVNPSFKGNLSWARAYSLALRKTITNLTKGWATEFIIMNMTHFIKPKYNYFKHALEATKEI